jgi:hypothetical protein
METVSETCEWDVGRTSYGAIPRAAVQRHTAVQSRGHAAFLRPPGHTGSRKHNPSPLRPLARLGPSMGGVLAAGARWYQHIASTGLKTVHRRARL